MKENAVDEKTVKEEFIKIGEEILTKRRREERTNKIFKHAPFKAFGCAIPFGFILLPLLTGAINRRLIVCLFMGLFLGCVAAFITWTLGPWKDRDGSLYDDIAEMQIKQMEELKETKDIPNH